MATLRGKKEEEKEEEVEIAKEEEREEREKRETDGDQRIKQDQPKVNGVTQVGRPEHSTFTLRPLYSSGHAP